MKARRVKCEYCGFYCEQPWYIDLDLVYTPPWLHKFMRWLERQTIQ